MERILLPTFLVLFSIFQAEAQSDAEVQGRDLAQQVLDTVAQRPAGNVTNTGILEIRGDNGRTRVPLSFKVVLTPTNWQHIYEADPPAGAEKLTVTYHPGQPPTAAYESPGHAIVTSSMLDNLSLRNQPFAGSDFSIGDLDLSFLTWPSQKVLKKDIHRSRGCIILISTNPHPSVNDYSRVQSWVDTETLGIVEAYAYDADGKEMKDFYPKNFKKVNGQYQVETLIMENELTGSRSRLDFDWNK